jgi:nickel/cobalt exporter
MTPIADLIQQGSGNALLFVPSAILLGALHGLEPGHSKTMMASFIIAVRGTIGQAILLGLCAAFSHSLVVWLLAVLALKFGNALIAEQAEPWFMLASGAIVLGVAVWMLLRTRRDDLAARAQQQPPHGGRIINTGHGVVELLLHKEGNSARFRLYHYTHHMRPARFETGEEVLLDTLRPDGSRQAFALAARDGFLESADTVPLPHTFEAVLTLGHADHRHEFELGFAEPGQTLFYPHKGGGHAGSHPHGHAHPHGTAPTAPMAAAPEYQDAHERAHAEDIKRRFAGREVSTGQIALFGLTGGLLPCPASVTVMIVCLHLKRFALGLLMVASFSLGLAIALVSVGVAAAWGARQAGKRFGGGKLGNLARKMPYASSAIMALVGLVMGIQGLVHILG